MTLSQVACPSIADPLLGRRRLGIGIACHKEAPIGTGDDKKQDYAVPFHIPCQFLADEWISEVPTQTLVGSARGALCLQGIP